MRRGRLRWIGTAFFAPMPPGSGVDNLLLEDGSNLLLEDGSVLLLE